MAPQQETTRYVPPYPNSGPHPFGRETPGEQAGRNLVELLQELRVVQTGVQIAFVIRLGAAFTSRFPELDAFDRRGAPLAQGHASCQGRGQRLRVCREGQRTA
ncbi:DUF6328 family protein [Streptomyces sp. NBC_01618]|uniref:DUF6328 family protein n=1 Tax=Streptomyces sp. NBC_01618 TaxID=2975900 RepID=UPI00386A65FD